MGWISAYAFLLAAFKQLVPNEDAGQVDFFKAAEFLPTSLHVGV